jgi:hypothetical protein
LQIEQNPWLGGCRPQIPILSVLCHQLNLLNPYQIKFLGTPLSGRSGGCWSPVQMLMVSAACLLIEKKWGKRLLVKCGNKDQEVTWS